MTSSICKVFFLFSMLFGCACCTKQKKERETTAHLYLQADPFSLDPRVGGDRRSQLIIRELYEGLTRVGPTGKVELALASSYTVSDDGLMYTFTLKPSLWSNGEPVSADDFAYAWKSLLSPSFATPFAYAFYVIKNAKAAKLGSCPVDEVGIKALDPHTLQITLEHPAPYFFDLTSNPLYSPIFRPIAEKDPHWATKSGDSYVSNGPFCLKEKTPKSHISLEKNPTYSGLKKPTLQALSFAIIDDPMTAYSLFSKGDLDWIGDPCGNMPLEVIKNLTQAGKLIKKETGKVYWFVVGTHHKHLSSPTIRKALAQAIDRKSLCSYLLQNNDFPAFSFLPTRLSLMTEPTFQDNNPQEAQKLFEQGLQELGIERKDFPGIILSHWSDPTDKAIAQSIQQQIATTLHIKVTLATFDWSTFLKKITTGDLEIGAWGWYSWFDDPMYNLESIKYTTNGINGTHWHSDTYTALLDQVDQTQDPNQRKELMKQAETLAMTELPLIPVCSITYKYAKALNLTGEVLSPIGIMELKDLKKE